MRWMLIAVAAVMLAASWEAHAGLFDDIKSVVDGVNEVIDDTKETKKEVEDVVDSGKELVPEKEWHVAQGSGRSQVSEARLAEMIEAGSVERGTLVWTQGFSDWQPAGGLSALSGYFEKAPPPTPAVASEGPPPLPAGGPPPLPRSRGKLEDQL